MIHFVDPAQDDIAKTSSRKAGKSSSNISKVNRKPTAEGETASKISNSCFSELLVIKVPGGHCFIYTSLFLDLIFYLDVPFGIVFD